jgi:hypothetical protein
MIAIAEPGLRLSQSRDNSHTKEYDEFYQIAGVSEEHSWIRVDLPVSRMPDFEVISMETIETIDPSHMFKQFATSNYSYAGNFFLNLHRKCISV